MAKAPTCRAAAAQLNPFVSETSQADSLDAVASGLETVAHLVAHLHGDTDSQLEAAHYLARMMAGALRWEQGQGGADENHGRAAA